MRIVAFVPIKLNSERVKNKNIKSLDNGDPLIKYILNTLKKVKAINDIYVFCSSENIKNYLPENILFLKRDHKLDLNMVSITEVIAAFISKIQADVYILTHSTSPFITETSIEKGINAVVSGNNDSALAVECHNDFLWINGKPKNYDICNIPRTQDLEPFYIETSGFYIFTQDVAKQNRRIGNNPFLVEVSKIEATDIDELIDFEIANAIYNYIIKNKDNLE